MGLRFEWDKKKAESNLKKHEVSFEEAITSFDDPLAVIFDDLDHSEDEQREIIIGRSILERLVFVCFVERKEDIIRIFSARLPTGQERKDYEENAKH